MTSTLIYSADAAFPDRPGDETGMGLLATCEPGDTTGIAAVIELAVDVAPLHIRLLFNAQQGEGALVGLLRLTDATVGEIWRVTLAPQAGQLHIITGSQQQVTVPLDDGPGWRCLELAFDPDVRSLAVHLDGMPRGASLTRIATAVPRQLWVGPFVQSQDAAGKLRIDELVIDTEAIGPVLVAPDSEHADDPARWLVLYNRNQPGAAAWADSYRARRAVPHANLAGLDAPLDEWISAAAYVDLQQQVLDYLGRNHLDGQVLGILAGFGIPGFADIHDSGEAFSVAALLARPTDLAAPGGNPLHVDSADIQRPDRTALAGDFLTARIDGLDAQATLERFSPAAAVTCLNEPTPPERRIYIDAHTSPGASHEWLTSLQQWLAADHPGRLRMHAVIADSGDTAETSDFFHIVKDAFYFGFHIGHDAATLFGTDAGPRLLAVQCYSDATMPSLRRADPLTWMEHALAHGYQAVAGSSVASSAALLPRPASLFEALRRGWTLAEAWQLALPVLRYGPHLVGDPLGRVDWPASGWDVFGPAEDIAELDLANPIRRLPADVRTIETQTLPGMPGDDPARYFVVYRDTTGRPTSMRPTPAMGQPDGSMAQMPLLPHVPHRAGWRPRRVHDGIEIVARWARPLRCCRIHAVDLIAQDAVGVETASPTAFDPLGDTVRITQPAPSQTQRYRLAVRSPQGASQFTPWSAWVAPVTPADEPVRLFGAPS